MTIHPLRFFNTYLRTHFFFFLNRLLSLLYLFSTSEGFRAGYCWFDENVDDKDGISLLECTCLYSLFRSFYYLLLLLFYFCLAVLNSNIFIPQVISEKWGPTSVEIILQQDWFLTDGSGSVPLEGEVGEVVWSIPLFFASSTQVTSRHMHTHTHT